MSPTGGVVEGGAVGTGWGSETVVVVDVIVAVGGAGVAQDDSPARPSTTAAAVAHRFSAGEDTVIPSTLQAPRGHPRWG
ncbi:hypothetical protein MBRU_10690 [Mycolicibacterium brumae DSM 44177]|nr:hypothetical protein MBRU_10690 [Mycolicibacterium brumae DSM 44177]